MIVAAICLVFVVVGFTFLFFGPTAVEGPRTIPSNTADIVWESYGSDLVSGKILYPDYMHISEQKKDTGVGVTIAEFEPREFLTYFSNQNHVSLYPGGIDTPFFYGKTKEDEYTSETGQQFARTEYLTTDDDVWAVMLVPKEKYKNWQDRGFIMIQARLRDREEYCMSEAGISSDRVDCDPFAGEKTVYSGTVSDQFISVGYEIVNKNSFK